MNVLFSILSLIPDELESCLETMSMNGPTKNTVRGLIISKSKEVLTLMQQVMQASQVSNVTKEIVVRALDSWDEITT